MPAGGTLEFGPIETAVQTARHGPHRAPEGFQATLLTAGPGIGKVLSSKEYPYDTPPPGSLRCFPGPTLTASR